MPRTTLPQNAELCERTPVRPGLEEPIRVVLHCRHCVGHVSMVTVHAAPRVGFAHYSGLS
ncbi:hypothetical protein GCM10027169_08100 [Gordonia jinhuaensis]|uniref:Uncharacterized protein n=1 Tax=Gordonia jinhuaensis TaxID=1517702 RepID=A0A916THT6_9ACTN|nr:hypothetical protein GCM10011489_36440 [Gordonia jinhuaensis]